MAKAKKPPVRSLTIYLLKQIDKPLEDHVPAHAQCSRFEIGQGDAFVGVLFVKTTPPVPPEWAKFFQGFVDADQLGMVASPSAVLLIEQSERRFALTFGSGRFLLAPDCWEERFGLRVALNSIREDRLRSLDKLTFDAISTHTRTQASREARASEFGLDVEQDLLRAVTGTPADENIGRRMTGMDALNAIVRVNLAGLPKLLHRYLAKFNNHGYKRVFPWVDQVAEVKDKTLIATLTQKACDQINTASPDCWLCVPEIIDWTDVSGFRFGLTKKHPQMADVSLAEFVNLFGDEPVCADDLARRRVHAVSDEGNVEYEWSVLKCLYSEVVHDVSTYVLTGGSWFRVHKGFVASVDASFATIPAFAGSLPEFKHETEGSYCKDVADKAGDSFALMDQKPIHIGGKYDKVEFCDLFTKKKDLIHIKRYGASSVMSHLLAQGAISAEAFRSEPKFRHDALKLLPKEFRWAKEPPLPSDFQIVFAIVTDRPGPVRLPFFSRVNLKQTVRRLSAYGYRVALARIPVEETFAKLKKYK